MTRRRFARRPVLRGAIYCVRINDGGRRSWLSTGATTLKNANTVLDGWRAQEASGARPVADKAFQDAAALWLEAKEARVSPGCARVYRVYVKAWTKVFRGKRLRDVETTHVERYFRLRAKKVGPRSLNNERATLRSLFLFARRNGWTWESPNRGGREVPGSTARGPGPRRGPGAPLPHRGPGRRRSPLRLRAHPILSGLRRGTVEALRVAGYRLEGRGVGDPRGENEIPRGLHRSPRGPGAPRVPPPAAPARRPDLRAPRPGEVPGGRGARGGPVAQASRLPASSSQCRRLGIPMEITMHLSDHRDLATVLREATDRWTPRRSGARWRSSPQKEARRGEA